MATTQKWLGHAKLETTAIYQQAVGSEGKRLRLPTLGQVATLAFYVEILVVFVLLDPAAQAIDG